VRQQKTRMSATVELSDYARLSLEAWLEERRANNDALNPGTNIWSRNGRTLKRLRYAQIVKDWARLAYLDPKFYSTHSMRRTMASHVYKTTANAEVVRQLLGHGDLSMTSKYLGIDKMHAIDVKKKCRM
jgi:site-specific recombinase XerD